MLWQLQQSLEEESRAIICTGSHQLAEVLPHSQKSNPGAENEPYIHAAILSGDSSLQIMLRHVFPNMLGPVLVTAMLDIGTMMMELAGLSFLGLGAQIPMAEWGSMMSSGRSMIQTYPWVVLSPGIAIFVSVVIFNLLGDTVRDYLDPKNREAF